MVCSGAFSFDNIETWMLGLAKECSAMYSTNGVRPFAGSCMGIGPYMSSESVISSLFPSWIYLDIPLVIYVASLSFSGRLSLTTSDLRHLEV
jgi:hypothetical protein